MSLTKKAISSLNWQVLAISCQAIFTIVFVMIKSRIIAVDTFGIFAIVNILIAFITMFTDFGFGAALIQRKIIKDSHISFAFYSTLLTGIFLFFIIWLVTPLIVDFYDYRFDDSILLAVGFNIVILSLGIVSKSLIVRDLEFKKLFFVGFVSYFLGNILGIILALYGLGIWALISINMFMNILSVIIAFRLKPHSLKVIFDKKTAKEIFKFGAGLTLLRIINQLSIQVDKLIIGKTMSPVTLGFYERSLFVSTIPRVYIGTAIDGVLFSTLSKIQSNIEEVRNLFFTVLSLLAIFMSIIFVIFFFNAKAIILIMLGENWLEALPIFKILTLLIIVQLHARFTDTLVRSLNAIYKSTKVKLVYLLAVTSSVYLFYPYGIEIVSLMVVLSCLIHSILLINLSLKLTKTSLLFFIQSLLPSVYILSLLVVKNILFTEILVFTENDISNFGINLITDLILLILFFKHLIGKENTLFLTKIIANNRVLKSKYSKLLQRVLLNNKYLKS